MSAFLVGHIKVRNEKIWADYLVGVKESLAPFSARVLFRGRLHSVLAGEQTHDLTVVIEFTDQAALQQWYHSSKYQALIPVRDAAADVVLAAYDA